MRLFLPFQSAMSRLAGLFGGFILVANADGISSEKVIDGHRPCMYSAIIHNSGLPLP